MARKFQWQQQFLRHFTYFRVHLLYIFFLALIGAVVVFFIEDDCAFIDALFMATSASCVTGLVTVNFAAWKLGSQITICLLMLLGSTVLTSIVPVLIRRHYMLKAASRVFPDARERDAALNSEIEYCSLGWVAGIALAYFTVVQLTTAIFWGLYFTLSEDGAAVMAKNNVNAWWWGFLQSVAGFSNAGFCLIEDNMVQLAGSYAMLLPLSITIVLGNVGYPVVFRGVVWVLHSMLGHREPAFAYLLEHPRRCYTHMFVASQTAVLAAVLIGTTVFEFCCFLIFDYGLPFLSGYSGPTRALIGYFQAISTRAAGFNAIDISQVSIVMQLVYLAMMYLSSVPLIISLRRSRLPSNTKAVDPHEQEQPLLLGDGPDVISDDDARDYAFESKKTLTGDGATKNAASLPSAAVSLAPPRSSPLRSYSKADPDNHHHHHRRMAYEEEAPPPDLKPEVIAALRRMDPYRRMVSAGGGLVADSTGSALSRASFGSDPVSHGTANSVMGVRSGYGTAVSGVGAMAATTVTAVAPCVTASGAVAAVAAAAAAECGLPSSTSAAAAAAAAAAANAAHGYAVRVDMSPPPRTNVEVDAVSSVSLQGQPRARNNGRIIRVDHAHRRDSYVHHEIGLNKIHEEAEEDQTEDGAAEADGGADGGATQGPRKPGVSKLMDGSGDGSVAQQLTTMFGNDVLWLFITLLVISIAERGPLSNDPYPRAMSVFTILFDIVSAYGTVGLSLGYPGVSTSLSGRLSVVGKLVICAVMVAGRHRGLPVSIDPAVYLPTLLAVRPQDAVPVDMSLVEMAQMSVAIFRRRNRGSIGQNSTETSSTIGGRGGGGGSSSVRSLGVTAKTGATTLGAARLRALFHVPSEAAPLEQQLAQTQLQAQQHVQQQTQQRTQSQQQQQTLSLRAQSSGSTAAANAVVAAACDSSNRCSEGGGSIGCASDTAAVRSESTGPLSAAVAEMHQQQQIQVCCQLAAPAVIPGEVVVGVVSAARQDTDEIVLFSP